MKFSLDWINKYTKLPLNEIDKLDEVVNKIAFQLVDVDERWLDSRVIDVDNKIITNRAYCFGHRGLSREVAIMLDQEWSGGEYPKVKTPEKTTLPIEVEIQDKDLCWRFCAVSIKGIKVGPSPEWLVKALEVVGQRSINNIVDITNYVMLDTSQPVHAYDYKKVKDGKIIVRRAKNGEKVITLDEVERDLNEENLLITDSRGVIGIAGVMGANNSQIDENTTDIILEVASFNPVNIRQTAKQLKHRTDASLRFEKGIDINNIPNVISLLANLVCEVCGGEVASNLVDKKYLKDTYLRTEPKKLHLDTNRVKKLMGFNIDKNFIKRVLKGFGINILSEREEILELEIPPYRQDINEPADLIEDIGRMYGYQNIPNLTPINSLVVPRREKKLTSIRKSRAALRSSGFDEIITYSFISKKDKETFGEDSLVEIINPLSKEYEYLRDSLLPSHIKVVSLNSKNFAEFGVFEISRKFISKGEVKSVDYNIDHGDSRRPKEIEVISMMYHDKNTQESIYKVKGAVENLMEALGINNFIIDTNGEVCINNQKVGDIGLISKNILDTYDVNYLSENCTAYCELELKQLIDNVEDKVTFKEFSRNQGSVLDFSVLINERTSVKDLLDVVKPHDYISSQEVIDVYRDSKFLGKKSVTIRFNLQKMNENITDSEIYDIGKAIEDSLSKIDNIEIRGGGLKKPANYTPTNVSFVKEDSKDKQTTLNYKNIVIGKIVSIDKHPNADKLSICMVDVGDSKPEKTLHSRYVQIITGAKNIQEGDVIPVALPGARVKSYKDGQECKIKVGNLRGEKSEGMLCSKVELGLEDDGEGIWILNKDNYDRKVGGSFGLD